MNIRKTLSFILIFILMMSISFVTFASAAPIIVNPGNSGTDSSGNSTYNGGYEAPVVVDIMPSADIVVQSAPVITKHPTDETITKENEKSECVFLANADSYTSAVWWLYNEDSSTSIYAENVSKSFPGVTASGYDTNRLVLTGITDKMNGWKAACEFKNAVGSARTGAASITIEEIEETPAPTPSPTPIPTPTPVPANVNNNSLPGDTVGTGNTSGFTGSMMTNTTGNSNITPIASPGTVEMPSSDDIVMTGTGTGSAGTAKNSHIGAYILAALAGALIVGSILVMALYMRGRISLGKFEQFLGGDNIQQHQPNLLDNDSEFYNPDDFRER